MSSAMPGSQIGWNADMFRQLACPACCGDLRLDGSKLVCGGCGRAYPIVDDIPVLIVERAAAGQGPEAIGEWQSGSEPPRRESGAYRRK